MGQFLTRMKVERLDGKEWKLTEPLIYDSDTVGLIIVPTGFVTDFASVPRLPVVYLLYGGVGDEESVLHDYLYSPPHNTGTGLIVDRLTADKVLKGAILNSLRKAGDWLASFKAWSFYLGVRAGGASHWKD